MKKFIQWLKKRRWFTDSTERAEKSIFQWAFMLSDGDGYKFYGLSILGVINGVLPFLGTCLVVIDDERLEFRKPWW